MSLVIGVDGGGTKTHIAMKINEDRTLLFHTIGTNYETIGFRKIRSVLNRGIENLLSQADKTWQDISSACFGMAGIDYEIDKKNFEKEIIQKIPLACRFRIENDAFIALKAGTDSESSIVLNAGTGIKAYGVSGKKELYSDAVGIESLQRRIINALGRELELNSRDNALSADLFKHLNVKDPYDYLRWVFLYNKLREPACPYPENLIYGYPQAFFEILKKGNPFALIILDSLIDDLTRLISAMLNRLGSPIEGFELVLSGSIFMENTDLDFEELFCRKFGEIETGALPKKVFVLNKQPYEGAILEAEKLLRIDD